MQRSIMVIIRQPGHHFFKATEFCGVQVNNGSTKSKLDSFTMRAADHISRRTMIQCLVITHGRMVCASSGREPAAVRTSFIILYSLKSGGANNRSVYMYG